MLYGQSPEFVTDHQHYIEQLGSAKDSLYQHILTNYNGYIRRNPHDARVQLERCRFIQHAYYDEYEDYNPNQEEAEACANELIAAFPDNAEILLYPTDFLYGDTLRQYLHRLEGLAEVNTAAWSDYTWQVFQLLAQQYSYDDEHEDVITYGERASTLNDTLDLSLLLGRAYKQLANNEKAVEVLLLHMDSTNAPWDLNQKGELLLELGESGKAIEAFRMAATKNANVEDAGALGQALIDHGLAAEARAYLLKDYKDGGSWNADEALHALLQYDLTYGSADSARFTYRRLIDASFFNDPVGLFRLRLIAKDPLMGWTVGDVGRVLLFVVLVIVLLIVPYLWILPIHHLGNYLKQKGKITDDATFRWRLRHFWLACSLWLICDLLTTVFFSYPAFITYFNDQFRTDDFPLISKQHADLTIFFTLACLVFTLALLKWEEIKSFLPKLRLSVNLRAIGVGIGLALALRFGLGIYVAILKLAGVSFGEQELAGIADVQQAIISVNEFYSPAVGLLVVAILVPIYEEILFRGVFLSACQRNMNFMAANILQSVVFAFAHEDLKLVPFFVAFGMVAGFYTRKTESLITGTAMHMMNNLLAFLGIYFLGGR